MMVVVVVVVTGIYTNLHRLHWGKSVMQGLLHGPWYNESTRLCWSKLMECRASCPTRLAVYVRHWNWESRHQLLGGTLAVSWPRVVIVGCLLNVPATCECISGTDLLRQFDVLPHWDGSYRSDFPSHPVTVYWHRADQSQRWPYNTRRLAG